MIHSAFETLGPDHICFGTDYPYELGSAPYVKKVLEDVNTLQVGVEDKKKFFGGNLKKAFRVQL